MIRGDMVTNDSLNAALQLSEAIRLSHHSDTDSDLVSLSVSLRTDV